MESWILFLATMENLAKDTVHVSKRCRKLFLSKSIDYVSKIVKIEELLVNFDIIIQPNIKSNLSGYYYLLK